MFSFKKIKKFPDPLDTAIYTTTYVVEELRPITIVVHELDGDWQFMSDAPIPEDYKTVARLISIGEIIKLDKTVLEVADLPVGYQATRAERGKKWKITKVEYTDEEIANMGFYCVGCGRHHRDIPMAYGADTPFQFGELTEEDRADKAELHGETCIINQKDFFIKGNLLLPVEGNESFNWNIWVKIAQPDFDKILETWDDENRFLQQPYEGVLATRLSLYPETIGLKIRLRNQRVGVRPHIEVLESSHPLFAEQESGINRERVIEFAKKIMYNH